MTVKTETSNYEKMKNDMAKVFLKYDRETMIRKFDLSYDENFLYLVCLDRNYRISCQTGQVSWSEDGFRTEESAGYNEAMTIYDVLCSSKEDCRLLGEW